MTLEERLENALSYDAETGEFRWENGNKRPAGGRASNGYRVIYFKRTCFLEHRLAWLFTYGEWPDKFIDHIDQDRSNNRIANLRTATRSQNRHNSTKVRSSSGLRGVVWNKSCQKWQAQIGVKRKKLYLGLFETPEEAAAAYKTAARKHFGEYAT